MVVLDTVDSGQLIVLKKQQPFFSSDPVYREHHIVVYRECSVTLRISYTEVAYEYQKHDEESLRKLKYLSAFR